MKVTSVDLIPDNGKNVVRLGLKASPEYYPFQVIEILGLDADEIVSRFYGLSEHDARIKYHDIALQKRELVVKMGVNPNWGSGVGYAELRDVVYKMISTTRTGLVALQLNEGVTAKAHIKGFITKVETQQFSKDQVIQVTINCEEPMFKALTTTNVNLAGADPLETLVVDLESNAQHGFKMSMLFNAAVPNFEICDIGETWCFEVAPSGGFLIGDGLYISSEMNDKYVFLQRGPQIQLADKVTKDSVWPLMWPEENWFVCTPGCNWASLTYFATYWGV